MASAGGSQGGVVWVRWAGGFGATSVVPEAGDVPVVVPTVVPFVPPPVVSEVVPVVPPPVVSAVVPVVPVVGGAGSAVVTGGVASGVRAAAKKPSAANSTGPAVGSAVAGSAPCGRNVCGRPSPVTTVTGAPRTRAASAGRRSAPPWSPARRTGGAGDPSAGEPSAGSATGSGANGRDRAAMASAIRCSGLGQTVCGSRPNASNSAC